MHLVFRLFLCPKHCWYKPFVLHLTMLANLINAPLFLEDFVPILNIIFLKHQFFSSICILVGGLKRVINFHHYFNIFDWMLDRKVLFHEQRVRESYSSKKKIKNLKQAFMKYFLNFLNGVTLDISGLLVQYTNRHRQPLV